MWVEFQGPGFTMEVPSEWRVMASPQFQAIFFSPLIGQDPRRANLTVALQDVPDDTTARALVDVLNRMQADSYPDFSVVCETADAAGEVSKIQRTLRWRNPSSGETVLQHQACHVRDGLACILTGSRPDGLPDDVATGVDGVFQRMLASFAFHATHVGL